MPERVVIAGGSVGGLFAGLYLLQRGCDVHIYEKVPAELASRGAGIVTHQALFDALTEVGVKNLESLGVQVQGRVTFNQAGDVIGRMQRPQVLTAWGRLYQMLRDRFPDERYHGGVSVRSFEPGENCVDVLLDNDLRIQANLLVAADGINSSVRAQLVPDVTPRYAGYVCWRGLIPESHLSESALRDLFPFFGFTLPRGEQVLGYPVAGEGNDMRVGHRRYNLVWYRPADQSTELNRLLTDTEGLCNGVSIAPNRIRPEVVSALRQDSKRLLAPLFREAVEKCDAPFLQPIFDLGVKSMVSGRVVLLGDAAFVARPHVGMGVTKAADDARALARCIVSGRISLQALQAYDKERTRAGRQILERARKLGAYMQAQIRTSEEREQAELFRTPEAVMTETATSDFLST